MKSNQSLLEKMLALGAEMELDEKMELDENCESYKGGRTICHGTTFWIIGTCNDLEQSARKL